MTYIVSQSSALLVLQVLSGAFFFLNKLFLLLKKPIGWICGIAGASIIIVYFYCQMIWQDRPNLWILIILDFALIFLNSYGYVTDPAKRTTMLGKVLAKPVLSLIVKAVVIKLSLSVCFLVLTKGLHSAESRLEVLQFAAAVLFLLGTLLRAFNTRKTNSAGWLMYFLAHMPFMYVLYMTGSPPLVFFQALSLVVALLGICSERKK